MSNDCDFCETSTVHIWDCGDYWLCHACMQAIQDELNEEALFEEATKEEE